jgi:type I phosphodiesterase/nucleotide pyrophosphatase
MANPPERADGHRPWHRTPIWRDLGRTTSRLQTMLAGGLASLVSLAITFWMLPQISSDGALPVLRLVVLLAVIGLLMRWLLAGIAIVIGSVGVLLGGVLSQFVVVYLGIRLDPGVKLHGGVEAALVVSIVMSSISTLVGWLAYAGSDDAYLTELLRDVRRRARRIEPAPRTGLLVIQLDGLSAPLLDWMVMAGNLPHLGGWIRDGSHARVGWHTGVPATTPASQAGILHGASDQIPAFRWYEKATGRVMVTNRGRDAEEIQTRLSTGRGLLADGGVSISNNWSGDAPTSMLVISHAGLLPNARDQGYVRFFSSPQGLARGLVLSVAEMVKELHQGRRQRRRRLVPRVKRGGSYIALRALSNVLLRDLNVSLIAEQLVKGAPVVYCDFVDYDEVAHHAGPTRPEALQTLEGLDLVIGTLERIIALLPHSYEIVVLSDHGQSQGSTFLQRYGRTLTDVVDELVDCVIEPVAATSTAEDWSPVNAFLTELSRRHSVAGSVSRRALRSNAVQGEAGLGPADGKPPSAGEQMVVTASGNLALVYLARTPGRVRLEELETRHPRLVPGLAMHPGVGFVVVDSLAEGPVAIGRAGVHVLRSGRIEGVDPLAPYGPLAAESMLRQSGLPHNGDIVVVSRLDEHTHEVAAFEELVGCHGGVGGWQTEAVLVHPRRWSVDEPPVGSDAVHRLLIGWLDQLGQRADVPGAEEVPAEDVSVGQET